ncbi:hypothetical protein DIPPA_31076 [Diplonema papillatum]|nr:hypothetical protein DIPPA_31076 [Diplonema papillatum]
MPQRREIKHRSTCSNLQQVSQDSDLAYSTRCFMRPFSSGDQVSVEHIVCLKAAAKFAANKEARLEMLERAVHLAERLFKGEQTRETAAEFVSSARHLSDAAALASVPADVQLLERAIDAWEGNFLDSSTTLKRQSYRKQTVVNPGVDSPLSRRQSMNHSFTRKQSIRKGSVVARKPSMFQLNEDAPAVDLRYTVSQAASDAASVARASSHAHEGVPAAQLPRARKAKILTVLVNGSDHEDTAIVASDLGHALMELNCLEEAVNEFRQAVDIYYNIYGDNHVLTATALNNLACVDIAIARAAESQKRSKPDRYYGPCHRAKASLERVVSLPQETLEEGGSDVVLHVLNNLASTELLLENTGPAQKHCEAALVYADNNGLSEGDMHPDVASIKKTLALVFSKKRDAVVLALQRIGRSTSVRERLLLAVHARSAVVSCLSIVTITTLGFQDHTLQQVGRGALARRELQGLFRSRQAVICASCTASLLVGIASLIAPPPCFDAVQACIIQRLGRGFLRRRKLGQQHSPLPAAIAATSRLAVLASNTHATAVPVLQKAGRGYSARSSISIRHMTLGSCYGSAGLVRNGEKTVSADGEVVHNSVTAAALLQKAGCGYSARSSVSIRHMTRGSCYGSAGLVRNGEKTVSADGEVVHNSVTAVPLLQKAGRGCSARSSISIRHMTCGSCYGSAGLVRSGEKTVSAGGKVVQTSVTAVALLQRAGRGCLVRSSVSNSSFSSAGHMGNSVRTAYSGGDVVNKVSIPDALVAATLVVIAFVAPETEGALICASEPPCTSADISSTVLVNLAVCVAQAACTNPKVWSRNVVRAESAPLAVTVLASALLLISLGLNDIPEKGFAQSQGSSRSQVTAICTVQKLLRSGAARVYCACLQSLLANPKTLNILQTVGRGCSIRASVHRLRYRNATCRLQRVFAAYSSRSLLHSFFAAAARKLSAPPTIEAVSTKRTTTMQAATTIQRYVRGFLVRQQLSLSAIPRDGKRTSECEVADFIPGEDGSQVAHRRTENTVRDGAAIMIQAAWKGHKHRAWYLKNLSVLRADAAKRSVRNERRERKLRVAREMADLQARINLCSAQQNDALVSVFLPRGLPTDRFATARLHGILMTRSTAPTTSARSSRLPTETTLPPVRSPPQKPAQRAPTHLARTSGNTSQSHTCSVRDIRKRAATAALNKLVSKSPQMLPWASCTL